MLRLRLSRVERDRLVVMRCLRSGNGYTLRSILLVMWSARTFRDRVRLVWETMVVMMTMDNGKEMVDE